MRFAHGLFLGQMIVALLGWSIGLIPASTVYFCAGYVMVCTLIGLWVKICQEINNEQQ